MDHFPVPRSKDLTSVRKNIIEALGRLGFVKPPFICVDCKKLNVEYVHDALLVSTGRIFYGPKRKIPHNTLFVFVFFSRGPIYISHFRVDFLVFDLCYVVTQAYHKLKAEPRCSCCCNSQTFLCD